MALSRRTGQRLQGSIWPGFVDAVTGLLMVLVFVLTIFMVMQYVLRETISGQDKRLDSLSSEIAALAQALGLEQRRSAALSTQVGELDATLAQARTEAQAQQALIAALQADLGAREAELQAAQGQITSFEAQVASLLAARDDALANVATLEGEKTALLSQQEALNAALASARAELDAGAEAARLAAARREALEALIADLRQQAGDAAAQAQTREEQLQALIASLQSDLDTARSNLGDLQGKVAQLDAQLSDAEMARLAEAAAAQALRKRLENADAELTAMTMALEAQRKQAEDTLTLLAAARAAEDDLAKDLAAALAENQKLNASEAELAADAQALRAQLAQALAAKLAAEGRAETALTEAEQRQILLAEANKALQGAEAQSTQAQRQQALLNQQVAALRTQLGALQALLDDYKDRAAADKVQLQTLGSDLNAALARAAAEERRRRLLEEAERQRLEAEKRDLEKYRSEFFGRLRDILGGQDGVRIEGDRFVFSSEVLFPPGDAELSAAGMGEVAKVAAILRNVAGEIPDGLDWIIRVDGHTDNVPLSGEGDFADNWELSQARALSVVRHMITNLGIPPNRLAANGFGEFQPVNPENTPEARAQNRRIELKLTER